MDKRGDRHIFITCWDSNTAVQPQIYEFQLLRNLFILFSDYLMIVLTDVRACVRACVNEEVYIMYCESHLVIRDFDLPRTSFIVSISWTICAKISAGRCQFLRLATRDCGEQHK